MYSNYSRQLHNSAKNIIKGNNDNNKNNGVHLNNMIDNNKGNKEKGKEESTININNLNDNNNNNNILKDIWEDSNMYDFIIDYYCSNIWGIENMCKIVKIDYGGKTLDIFKDLLKEYGGNKMYKNHLIKVLDKYFNINDIDKKGRKRRK